MIQGGRDKALRCFFGHAQAGDVEHLLCGRWPVATTVPSTVTYLYGRLSTPALWMSPVFLALRPIVP